MYKYAAISFNYAKAAFLFSLEHQNIKYWMEMLKFVSKISNNSLIKILINSHAKSDELIFKYFKNICGNKIDKNFQNYLKIIIENQRLHILPDIFYFFKKIKNKFNNIKIVKLVSSHKLEKKQINEIINVLEKKYSCKINITLKINKFLISGIILNIEGYIIDGSVRNHINNLNNILNF